MYKGLTEDEAANEIVQHPMKIPTNLLRINEIEGYISENDFDVVFIDYIQLVQADGKSEYEKICERLGFSILDFSIRRSDIGGAFNDGKLKAILRLFLFMTGLRKPITKNSNGSHLYMLLKSTT